MNAPQLDKAALDHLKEKTARLSVISNSLLVLMKFIVGFAIGSVSIISEAIHSSMDLIAAVIAFFSVRKSAEPPDAHHEFGHGKFEDISGLIEALLIFVAAILIIREALLKLIGEPSDLLKPELLIFGIAVMGISALVNWFVSHRLMNVARQSESIALESDAWHLRTDVYTSLGVFFGLILIRLTGITIFDPLFALGVAIVIMKAAYDLTRRSLSDLIDHSIPAGDEQRIKEIICDHASSYAGFHDLKTRRSVRKFLSNSTSSYQELLPCSSLMIFPTILNQTSWLSSRGQILPFTLNPAMKDVPDAGHSVHFMKRINPAVRQRNDLLMND